MDEETAAQKSDSCTDLSPLAMNIGSCCHFEKFGLEDDLDLFENNNLVFGQSL